jgi:serine/threonine-protein kinase
MPVDPRVLDLLVRYEERVEAGESVTPELLCADCPELLPQVRQQLERLAVLDPMLGDTKIENRPPRAPYRPAPAPPEGAFTGLRYRPVRFHAKGGLGEVHVADDTELGRPVALKHIQDRHAHSEEMRRRFLREAEITARLEHPGIVPVYGLVHDADGQPYYAMRFIEGESLRDAIQRFHAQDDQPRRDAGRRTLALRELLSRFIAVCNTMAYAHSRGVIHRDLKPGNVMLGKYGETLVVDWGLAKHAGAQDKESGGSPPADASAPPASTSLTEMGQAAGTPAYMSPEQAAGRWDAVGPASDVYSLGAILYALLTGVSPVAGRDAAEALQKVKRGDFPPPRQVKPGVPRALEAICLRAMALRPQDRYAGALELKADVEHWLADEPVSAYREPLAVRARRWLKRHRTLAAGVATGAAVALVSLALTTSLLVRANQDLQEANAREVHAKEDAKEAAKVARQAVHKHFTLVSESELSKEPGTQPLRRKLLEAALAYYQGFLRQYHDDPASRLEVAETHLRVADITKEIGPRAEARAHYERARDILEELVRRQPAKADYRSRLAQSYFNLGLLQGQPAAELRRLRRALDVWDELAAADPANPDFQDNCAKTYLSIGAVYRDDLGRPAEALRWQRRALAVWDRLARAHPAVSAYEESRADCHHNMSQGRQSMGRLADALAANEQSVAIRARLALAHPSEPRFQDRLARARFSGGNLRYALGRRGPALQAWQGARATWDELARANPFVTRYQEYLADCLSNIAVVQHELGRLADSLHSNEQALAIRERLARAQPSVRKLQARVSASHSNLGTLLYEMRRYADALRSYERALAISQKLAADYPSVAEFESDVASAYYNMARAQTSLRRLDDALRSYRKALPIRERLARAHPQVSELQERLAKVYNNIGFVENEANRPAKAVPAYRRALAIHAGLARAHPENPQHHSDVGIAWHNIAEALAKEGPAHTDEALAGFRQAVTHQRRARKRAPDNSEFRDLLGLHLTALAQLLRAAKKPAEAAAVTLERRPLAGKDPAALYNVACELALCAALAAEGSPARARYADQAVETLRLAVRSGYKDAKHMRADADLKALRSHDGFRKLLAEMTRARGGS